MRNRASTVTTTASTTAATAATAVEPSHHHNKVQHVYSLDVEALSDRLGLSQQELVDGIAKDHNHVALQEMLESVVEHDSRGSSDSSDSGSDADNSDDDNAELCRRACLLLPSPPSRDACTRSRDDKNPRFAPLATLDDGRTVLEHILHELFQPRIFTHVVVCAPMALHATPLHSAVTKIGSRLGASAKVRVQFLDIDATDSEARAVQRAARYLADTSPQRTRCSSSDGLLVLSCDRIFDAPTIRMMAMCAPRSAAVTAAANCSTAEVRVRALVDLDVELVTDADNNERDVPTHFAGIFAFMGNAAAIAGLLERACSRKQSSSSSSPCSTMSEFVESLATSGSSESGNDKEVRAAVEKVVASDYCSWQRDRGGAQLIERHSFHAPSVSDNNNSRGSHSRSRKADGDQRHFSVSPVAEQQQQRASDSEYFEFPREPHLLASRGYQGFQVDTTLIAAPASVHASHQHVGERTCEHKSLLDVSYSSSGSSSNSECSAAAAHFELTTEATTLTDTDLDALLGAKNRAFLFQIGPDAELFDHSVIPSDDSELQLAERLTRCEGSEGGVFLALPDVTCTRLPEPVGSPLLHSHALEWHDATQQRRRFSQLPSAVQEIKLEAVVQQQQPSAHASRRASHRGAVAVNVVVKTQVPAVGYAILITALVAVSSQGAAQDLLVGVPPLLKVFWRMTGASLAFAPFALRSVAASNWQLPQLAPRKRALFALCGVSYTIYNATFLVALSLTSVGHTYIFSNCHSLLLVLAKLAFGQPLGALELGGAAIGFAGGVITTLDHAAPSAAAPPEHALRHGPSTLGDMVALTGAFAGVAYLLSAKRVRPTMDVFVFMWALVTTVAALVLLVLLCWRTELGIQIASADATHGLAGGLYHLGIEAYVVLVGSFAGTMGFVTALKYFDPLVVSVTMLTEPVVATVIGIAIGVDQVPGPLTFLGGLTVLAGCSLVLLASHRTCTRVDVSDALEEPTAAAAAARKQMARGSGGRRRHSTTHQQQKLGQQSSFRVNYGSFP